MGNVDSVCCSSWIIVEVIFKSDSVGRAVGSRVGADGASGIRVIVGNGGDCVVERLNSVGFTVGL